MNYFSTLVESCVGKETDAHAYRLRDLIPDKMIAELAQMSPVPELETIGIDVGKNESDARPFLIRILKLYLELNTKMGKAVWYAIACTAHSTANSTCIATRTAGLSMLTQLAPTSAILQTTILQQPLIVEAEPFVGNNFLANFLDCEHVDTARRSAAGNFFTDQYKIPPYVIVFDGLHECLQGFLCFNNCVAVRKCYTENYEYSACSQLHLANLISHEIQLGLWRVNCRR